MEAKRKFISLLITLSLLIAVLAIMIGIINYTHTKTLARYIMRKKDEVRAYYTSLYFDGTGDGTGIAIEDNVGYANFDLMNYINSEVTKRDIVYEIKTVRDFYDKVGNPITDPGTAESLNVKDIWEQPVEVGKDTYKYNIDVIYDNGEEVLDGSGNVVPDQYMFSYEERGTSAVGKKHKVTIKVERQTSYTADGNLVSIPEINKEENISIVIQLLAPYRTVFVIDMIVSDRLIMFSNTTHEAFGTKLKNIQIQTADVFSHTKSGTVRTSIASDDLPATNFTSAAFRVTLTWENILLDENVLKFIHNNVDGKGGEIKEGEITQNDSASYLDISKPYIVSLDQKTDSGTLVIYVPEGSNVKLDFFTIKKNFSVFAKVEIFIGGEFRKYGKNFLGYETLDTNDSMVILQGTVS